jgi:hypothetical protein
MAHHNTILSQITTLFPRHEFERLAKIHHRGQKFRSCNRWSQFLVMMIAQLSGRKSLGDLMDNIKVQGVRLYHLGMKKISKAHLARFNEKQPHELYHELFSSLLDRCQRLSPGHRFKFEGKIYLLDTPTINLCLEVFPWATFRKTKGAIKLHTGLDADGYLPAFMDMTEGKTHEIQWARSLQLPPGSCVIFDRGFTDYSWYQKLSDNKIFFVTRLKKNAVFELLSKRRGRKSAHIKQDQTILLRNTSSSLRLICSVDQQTGKEYHFLTNSFDLKAATIAEMYKERWKIELFFKWIKQNLKVKTFLGTTPNAVLTQLWIALCVYLLLAYLKFRSRLGQSLTQILRLLQLNLFERRDLIELFKPPNMQQPVSQQLLLWN